MGLEYLSKEARDKIAAELEQLINVEYPKVKDDLSEARAQGDLSENFGYRAARRTQAKTISRIRYLQNILKYSRVIDTSNLPKDQITLLSKVEITNLDTNAKATYTIVSPHEMDLAQGKISLKSPIGQALMGKKAGEEITVQAPAATLRFKIDKVTPV